MKLEIGSSGAIKKCARCATEFTCGAASGSCWCFALPKVLAVPASRQAGCVCPVCLKAAIASQNNGKRPSERAAN